MVNVLNGARVPVGTSVYPLVSAWGFVPKKPKVVVDGYVVMTPIETTIEWIHTGEVDTFDLLKDMHKYGQWRNIRTSKTTKRSYAYLPLPDKVPFVEQGWHQSVKSEIWMANHPDFQVKMLNDVVGFYVWTGHI